MADFEVNIDEDNFKDIKSKLSKLAKIENLSIEKKEEM